MKNLLFASLVIFGLGTSAMAADELTPVLVCNPLQLRPDVGMSVVVSVGGIAGMTQLQVNHFFLGRRTTRTHIVHRQQMDPKLVGSPVVYRGRDVILSVNFTSSPTPQGGHYGTLTEIIGGDAHRSYELSCKSAEVPEVNYAN